MMYARAYDFLLDSLAKGPRPPSEVIAAAERVGIEYTAVLLAARSVAQGDGVWRLRPAAAAQLAGRSVRPD